MAANEEKSPKGGVAPKPVITPDDKIHIVAAILAAGSPQTQVPPERPNFANVMLITKYRQFVRMLSRSHDELSGDDDE